MVFVQEFKLLLWPQVVEAIAEKINFLLYEPAPEVLPSTQQSGTLKIPSYGLHQTLAYIMHLRLTVGKSEDEVRDVVLSSFVLFTWSSLRFSFILNVFDGTDTS